MLKSCLAIFGAAILLLVGTCTLGGYGLYSLGKSIADLKEGRATHFTQFVGAKPDEVRAAVYGYLNNAAGSDGGAPVAVNAMSDGSVRLVMGKGDSALAAITVAVAPGIAEASNVAVDYDVARFAAKDGTVTSTALNAELYAKLKAALDEIGRDKSVAHGFDFAELVTDAKTGGASRRSGSYSAGR